MPKETKETLVSRARERAWWIWVRDKESSSQRWAKADEVPIPITLGAAVALCADWNTRAERHEYTVRPYRQDAGPLGPVVGVRVEGFGAAPGAASEPERGVWAEDDD